MVYSDNVSNRSCVLLGSGQLVCQRSSPSSMPTWMPLRKLNTSSILRCSVSACVCVLVCKLWLSVQVAAIAVCLSLFLHTYLHSPSLLFSPLPLSSRLSSITLLASLISLFTLHCSLLITNYLSPTPSHTPPHYPPPTPFHTPSFPLSLSLPLSIYHLPFPFSLPHCRISSSFLTCQVMKFKMAYRRHFGSGLHVPTKRGKSFV